MKKQICPQLKTLLIIFALTVVLSNTPPAAFFLLPNYHYQTNDGKFHYTEQPGKGLDYEILKIRFERFIYQNPNITDKKLYRTFTIKPWQFWQWWEMIYRKEKFSLPYLEP